MPTSRTPSKLAYLNAALVVVLAFLIRWLLNPLLQEEGPFIIFFLAVIWSAWHGGWKPGMLATIISVLLAVYFFVPPDYSLRLANPQDWGRPIAFLISGGFISWMSEKRLRGEETLRENERQFRLLTENLQDVLYIGDAAGQQVRYVSPAYEKVWGRSRESLYRQPLSWLDSVHPDDRERVLRALQSESAGGRFNQQYRIVRDNGQICWIWARSFPLYEGARRQHQVVGIAQDITASKIAEEQVHQRANQLHAIYQITDALHRATAIEKICQYALDSLQQFTRADRAAILLYESDGVLRFRAWRQLSEQYRQAAAEGHSPWPAGETNFPPILVPDVEAADDLKPWQEVILNEGIRAMGYIPLLAENRLLGTFMIYYNAAHQFQQDELQWVQTIASQVSWAFERKRKEEILREALGREQAARQAAEAAEAERAGLLEREQIARNEAETANRMKDEFLATVSHELRTPLNSMLGWAAILRSHANDPVMLSRGLLVIERNSKAQSQLINELLDVSRIIAGKLHLDVRPCELVPVVEAAVDNVRPAAEAKEIQLQTLVDSDAGLVLGDPDRLLQVVWNLLSNAIKFTPLRGHIQVRVERKLPDVEITVTDTGKGIAPEFLPFVFDRFRQADGSLTRRHGGLGLGLAIVRHVVELHGGTVNVASPGLDQGSSFTVSLPLLSFSRPERNEREKLVSADSVLKGPAWSETTPRLDGVLVLLVDDDLSARELLVLALSQFGARVLSASSAAEAFRELEISNPDVLISDIEMPEEDGYSLIRKWRALERERGGHLPAAALTAHARREDRQRAISAGYDRHVAKPVAPDELAAVVASLVRGTGARARPG
jgi:PAS domain S-box-containing protein